MRDPSPRTDRSAIDVKLPILSNIVSLSLVSDPIIVCPDLPCKSGKSLNHCPSISFGFAFQSS